MASKGAIVPVGKVMKDAGAEVRPAAYVPAVAGYYTAPNGQMLSFPFNSSTTVFYYNKDAFKAAGIDPEQAARPPGPRWRWRPPSSRPAATSARSRQLAGWTQLESFSAWHNVEFATKGNGLGGLDARLAFNCAAARAPHREPGQHGQAGPVRLQGPRQQAPTARSSRASAR